MKASKITTKDEFQPLLENALVLHGHLGPFLVLGLRMALRASRILGERPRRCELRTTRKKPFLCVVDGIKAVVGECTIEIKEDDGLVTKFWTANGKEIIIKVKETALNKNAQVSWDKCEEYAHEVMQSKDEEIFDWVVST